MLSKHIMDGLPIDAFRLFIQQQSGNSAQLWYKLPFNMRRCIFLNEQNECRIYEDRPSVCRNNYVFSLPIHCSTENGKESPVRLLKTKEADMVLIGANLNSNENGALPFLIYKYLTRAQKMNTAPFSRHEDKIYSS